MAVVAAAGQAVEAVVGPSAVAALVVRDCMQDVAFAKAAPPSAAAAVAGDTVEEGDVVAVVDTSAPSHHAKPSHLDRGQYPLYSGSEYAQALGQPVRVAE